MKFYSSLQYPSSSSGFFEEGNSSTNFSKLHGMKEALIIQGSRDMSLRQVSWAPN
jgi:hypothetical protein